MGDNRGPLRVDKKKLLNCLYCGKGLGLGITYPGERLSCGDLECEADLFFSLLL